MELTGKHRALALVCAGLWGGCGGDDDSCDLGSATRCEEHSGPLEVRYCRPDETWSECTLALDCNPLTQEGCGDGLACFFEYPWTFCAPPATFPCEPGQFAGSTLDGELCEAHCAHDGRDGVIFDAPECEEDEWCYPQSGLPEGVGICAVRDY